MPKFATVMSKTASVSMSESVPKSISDTNNAIVSFPSTSCLISPISANVNADVAESTIESYIAMATQHPHNNDNNGSILSRLTGVIKELDSVISDVRQQLRKIRASNRILSSQYDYENPSHVHSMHTEHALIVMLNVLCAIRLIAVKADSISTISCVLLPVFYITRMAGVHLSSVDLACSKKLSNVSLCFGSIILDTATISGAKLDLSMSNKEASLLFDQAKLTANFKLKKQYPKLEISGACGRCY